MLHRTLIQNTALLGFGSLLGADAMAQSGSLANSQSEVELITEANGRWYLDDVQPWVPHVVFDSSTQAFGSLPISVASTAYQMALVAGGDFELIGSPETVLLNNGDGDLSDRLLVVRRISTGALTPTSLAAEIQFSAIASDGSIAAIVVHETWQNVDYDQDGKKESIVLLAFDPATTQTSFVEKIDTSFPLPSETMLLPLDGGEFVYRQSEVLAGADLNGDGDTADHAFRLRRASGAVETIPLGVSQQALLDVSTDASKFHLEYGQASAGGGQYLIDRATLGLQKTNLNLRSGVSSNGEYLAQLTDELDVGVDANGDGDQGDYAAVAIELATGAVTVIPSANADAIYGVEPFAIGADFVAWEQIENPFGEPAVDWNGDGDTWDSVVFVHELSTGASFTLPVGVVLPSLAPDRSLAIGNQLMVRASEMQSGATDLNYDGDLNDHVLVVFDGGSKRFRNLAVSATKFGAPHPANPRIGFLSAEAEEGGSDRTGDGDTADHVAWIYDSAASSLFSTGLAQNPQIPILPKQPVSDALSTMILVDEKAQGAELSHNGSPVDSVPFFHVPEANGCGAFQLYGSGCATSAGRVPVLDMHGCAYPGGGVRLEIRDGIAGQPAFLVFGAGMGASPISGGCTLLVSPLLPITLGPLPLTQNGIFGGAVLVDAALPPSTMTGTLHLQAFVADAGLPRGFAASHGLALTIAP